MSIDKDILDRLMEGRSPGDLFGKTGILAELTKALAERALSTEMDVHLEVERAEGEVGRSTRPPQTSRAQPSPADRRSRSIHRSLPRQSKQATAAGRGPAGLRPQSARTA